MNRTQLIRHLVAEGCALRREGSRHSIWRNPATGAQEAVPRHSEVSDKLVRDICRKLGIPDPRG